MFVLFLCFVFLCGYLLSVVEMKEFYDVISWCDGVCVLFVMVGFVDEYCEYVVCWDLVWIILVLGDEVVFGVVGSVEDLFEGE